MEEGLGLRRGVGGAWLSQPKLLQHLSGFTTDKREYCSKKLKPCGKVKGFNPSPENSSEI